MLEAAIDAAIAASGNTSGGSDGAAAQAGQTATQGAAPAVGGPQAGEPGNVAAPGASTPQLPGWALQLTKDQQEDIKKRVAEDPKALEKIPKGLPELYAQYAALEASQAGAIKMPAKDAPKEQWDQFYQSLGRPVSAEGYALEKPEIPAGMRYNDAEEKWFRGIAFALGLGDFQAKSLFSEWNKQQSAQFAAMQAKRNEASAAAVSSLKKEWGDHFPENWEKMRQSFTQFVPDGANGPFMKKLAAYGLDNDPDVLRFFRNIYERIGPPKFQTPSNEGAGAKPNEHPRYALKGLKQ